MMIKNSFLTGCVFFLRTAFLSAQITVDSVNTPHAGDSYLTATDTLPSVTVTPGGASAQAWDFTAMDADRWDSVSYLVPSATPYFSSFPSSDMSVYSIFNILGVDLDTYLYFVHQSNGVFGQGIVIDASGLGYGTVTAAATPPGLALGTPFSYGNVLMDTARYVADLDVNAFDGADTTYVHLEYKTLTGDAWGTLLTTLDTFNVIRIHEYTLSFDSIYVQFFPLPAIGSEMNRDTINNYYFYSDSSAFRHALATLTATPSDSVIRANCIVNYDTVTAAFTWAPGNPVNFVNTSVNAIWHKWYFGDGDSSTAVSPSHAYTDTGSYVVMLIASNPLYADTITDTIQVNTLDIEALPAERLMTMAYPNPGGGEFTLRLGGLQPGTCLFIMYDAAGNVVLRDRFRAKAGGLEKHYNLSSLPDGKYMYRLVAGETVLRQTAGGMLMIVR